MANERIIQVRIEYRFVPILMHTKRTDGACGRRALFGGFRGTKFMVTKFFANFAKRTWANHAGLNKGLRVFESDVTTSYSDTPVGPNQHKDGVGSAST